MPEASARGPCHGAAQQCEALICALPFFATVRLAKSLSYSIVLHIYQVCQPHVFGKAKEHHRQSQLAQAKKDPASNLPVINSPEPSPALHHFGGH